jgi:hypothetical protein
MPRLKSINLTVPMTPSTSSRVFERRLDAKYGLTNAIESSPLPYDVATASRVLSAAEYARYATLAPPPPIDSTQTTDMPDLHVMNGIEVGVRSFSDCRFSECFPSLESCHGVVTPDDPVEFIASCGKRDPKSIQDEQVVHVSDLQRVQFALEKNLSNLLYLYLSLEAEFAPHSVFERNLPHVLQLILLSKDTNISDVKFHCPQLHQDSDEFTRV